MELKSLWKTQTNPMTMDEFEAISWRLEWRCRQCVFKSRTHPNTNRPSKSIKKLLHYRKNSKAIQKGKLIHFAPFDGIYAYFVNSRMKSFCLSSIKMRIKSPLTWNALMSFNWRKNPVECHRSIKTVLEKDLTLEQKGPTYIPQKIDNHK